MSRRFAVVLVLLLWGGAACSPFSFRPETDTLRMVSGVPYRAQQARNDCGPAALASLLAHRGVQVGVEEVAESVYTPALDGTLLPDLENYARSLGFETRSGRGDLALLRSAVDSGTPVIALIQTGLWVISRPHYVVVYGYDEGGVLAHIGTREGVYVENEEFADLWSSMNRLYLYLE